jgi:DNA-binding MarR family transcriptional regulator
MKTLDALLPKTRQGILAALLVQPGKTWYVSELARRMGVPSSSLQRELQDLTAAGILKTTGKAVWSIFRQTPIHRSSPISGDYS